MIKTLKKQYQENDRRADCPRCGSTTRGCVSQAEPYIYECQACEITYDTDVE